ncbi:DUF5011 domain-containing protein, partial [Flavobacteriaceae bacterium]|nr:DUF5011 domain-containing protein [Flavobacteriaceae bacterium]
TDPGATALDIIGGEINVTTTGSVDSDTIGVYTLTYTATDSSGNTTTTTRTVNVVDTIAPTITLVGDNPITIEVGDTYTDAGATATDNYDTEISVTTTGFVDSDTIGVYTLTYTATDSSGNTTTATRTVNVVDTIAPVITLNGDNPTTIEVGTTFTDPGASATDNYDTEISVTVSGEVNSENLGSYTLTYTATDSSGNTTTATRTVNVVDTTAPIITLIGDNPITIEVGDTFTDTGATATDNYDTEISVSVTGTVDNNTIGVYTLTYTATDSSGNTTTATRIVNVVDTTTPVITLIGDNPMNIEVGGTFTDPGATATDNYDTEITVSVTGTVDNTTVGAYTLTYTATDSSDNSTTVTRIVNIFSPNYLKILDSSICVDQQVNNISLNLFSNDAIRAIQFDINFPSGFVLDNSNVTGTALLDDFTITSSLIGDNTYRFLVYTISNSSIQAGDNTILNLPVSVESSVDSGGYNFTISNVTLSNVDNQNIASEVLEIGTLTVFQDCTAPVIILIGDNPITIEVGTTFTDPGATALDIIDGEINVTVTGSVDANTVGVYTLTYTATDSSGNTATAVTRTVNVVDTTAPVITLIGDNSITIEVGSTYTDEGATVTDNYDTEISVTTTGSVDSDTVGVYTITYTATDVNGNSATTVTRTVNVVDTTAPVITLIGDNPITIEVGDTFTDPGASATDNYDTEISVTVSGEVNSENIGSYTLAYTATDSSGNTTTATRTVNVVDTTAPVITLNGDNPMTIEVGTTFTDEGATATDNYDAEISVSVTGTVDNNTVGDYTLTYTAIDSSDNITSVTRTVNVVDTTAPEVICQNITIELNESGFATVNADDINDGSNDFSGIQEYSIDIDYFDCSMIGDNNVTLNVIDNYGNSAQCTSVVTVIDNSIYPVAICNNLSISLENLFVEISYEDLNNGSYDNCEEITLSISQSEFNESHIGDNTVILTVTNSSGNTSSCEAIVTVEPGLSIEENILETINIYPNPTANVLYIKSNVSSNYHLYNMIGQKIISGQINEGDNELNLRQYSNGIYFIKFIKNNRVYTKKIIKN